MRGICLLVIYLVMRTDGYQKKHVWEAPALNLLLELLVPLCASWMTAGCCCCIDRMVEFTNATSGHIWRVATPNIYNNPDLARRRRHRPAINQPCPARVVTTSLRKKLARSNN